jgi:lysophospholipase L1-like esterase
MKRMNRPKKALASAAPFLALFVFLAPRPAAAQDRTAAPALSASKSLLVLSDNADNGLGLAAIDIRSAGCSERRFFPSVQGRLLSPSLRIDRTGRPWAVWEDWNDTLSRIGFGRLTDSEISVPQSAALPQGWNYSPDMCFDRADVPWLAWVNDLIGRQMLYVRDVGRATTWILAAAPSLLGPQILADDQGRIWVFWSAREGDRSQFYFRVFSGATWSPPVPVGSPSPFPVQAFSAAVDVHGAPQLVWSQYDGRDYEVYGFFHGLGPGSTRVALTVNAEAQDVTPSLGLVNGLEPVVSWVRYDRTGCSLRLKYESAGVWSGEKIVRDFAAEASTPQMTVSAGDTALAWWSGGALRWHVFSQAQLAGLPPGESAPRDLSAPFQPPPSPSAPRYLINPALDEARYIGFGDSITYGTIDSEFHPDLGYIPRLQDRLGQSFGPTTVFNEGVPSEITLTGMARLGAVLAADQARFILILEGTNDTITRIWSLEASAYNLREMTRQCLAAGVLPALATLLPRVDRNSRPARVLNLNQEIRSIAAEMAVPLLDLYQAFLTYPQGDGGFLSLISNDRLHPSEKGYQYLADQWYLAIRAFPFAPRDVETKQEYDRIRFRGSQGVMISWSDSPKIDDPSPIIGYRLYRRVGSGPDAAFELLAFVVRPRKFFDTDIAADTDRFYVVATVLSNGIEGPGSSPVKF